MQTPGCQQALPIAFSCINCRSLKSNQKCSGKPHPKTNLLIGYLYFEVKIETV